LLHDAFVPAVTNGPGSARGGATMRASGTGLKRIVVCLDGTWNQVTSPSTVTNVVRIAEAVRPCASDGVTQVVYYNSGVGTGDAVDRLLGGVVGRGVKAIVKRSFAFLSLNYESGDEIYLFGFSRGAYAARALGGLVTSSGILKQQYFDRFEIAWRHYRTSPAKRNQRTRPHAETIHAEATVACLGVWDTVGSYGVPAGFGIGALARYATSWQRGFHDTHVSDKVRVALQALAIDERRRPFPPTSGPPPPAPRWCRLSSRCGSAACTPTSAAATRISGWRTSRSYG
jgi:uncharacterized protein (DUF2235 family)